MSMQRFYDFLGLKKRDGKVNAPIKITGIGVLCIDKIKERNLAKGKLVVQLHLLCMPIGLSYIKKTIPQIQCFIDSGIRVIIHIEIISYNIIVGSGQVQPQRFGNTIIECILPIEQIITLLQQWQIQCWRAQ